MVLDIIATIGLSILMILTGITWIEMEDKERPDMMVSLVLETVFMVSLFAIWK